MVYLLCRAEVGWLFSHRTPMPNTTPAVHRPAGVRHVLGVSALTTTTTQRDALEADIRQRMARLTKERGWDAGWTNGWPGRDLRLRAPRLALPQRPPPRRAQPRGRVRRAGGEGGVSNLKTCPLIAAFY